MLIHTIEKKSILRAKLYVEYLYNYISKSNTFSRLCSQKSNFAVLFGGNSQTFGGNGVPTRSRPL